MRLMNAAFPSCEGGDDIDLFQVRRCGKCMRGSLDEPSRSASFVIGSDATAGSLSRIRCVSSWHH